MTRPPASDRTKSRMSRLARTGWRPGIMWSAPSTTTSGAPVSSARRWARAIGWQWSSVPWTMSIGQRHGSTDRLDGLLVEVERCLGVGEHRVDRAVERPLDGVLDHLGRVRLGRDRLEEEAREARVVAAPVVPVVPRPALVRSGARPRTDDGTFGWGGDRRGHADGEGDDAGDPVGVGGGEPDGPPDAVAAQADEDGARRRRWRP